jgi:hypothetical protein
VARAVRTAGEVQCRRCVICSAIHAHPRRQRQQTAGASLCVAAGARRPRTVRRVAAQQAAYVPPRGDKELARVRLARAAHVPHQLAVALALLAQLAR